MRLVIMYVVVSYFVSDSTYSSSIEHFDIIQSQNFGKNSRGKKRSMLYNNKVSFIFKRYSNFG